MAFPQYCEQALETGVFEPINTLTNLFFMAAGALMLYRLKKHNRLDAKGIYLSALLIIIGIGSFAWHFYRIRATLIADSAPIALFVLSFLYFYLKKMAAKTWHILALFIGFFVYTIVLGRLISDFAEQLYLGNGGMGYTIAISYFFWLQIYTARHAAGLLRPALISGLLFLLSIFFRQVDAFVCESIPFGTHFLWHTLNAVVLYLFIELLYRPLDKGKKYL